MEFRTYIILLTATLMLGCSSSTPKKELTEIEKQQQIKNHEKIINDIKLEVEEIKTTISNPIINVALSACQNKKKLNKWPNTNFIKSQKSTFESFETIMHKNKFKAKFKLKGSSHVFYLIISDKTIKIKENKHDKAKKKLEEELKEKIRAQFKSNKNQKINETIVVPDCYFYLNGIALTNNIKFNLNGSIKLGETWNSEQQRNKFAFSFLMFSKLSKIVIKKREENVIEKLLYNTVGEAFVRVSLCMVLQIKASNCFN